MLVRCFAAVLMWVLMDGRGIDAVPRLQRSLLLLSLKIPLCMYVGKEALQGNRGQSMCNRLQSRGAKTSAYAKT